MVVLSAEVAPSPSPSPSTFASISNQNNTNAKPPSSSNSTTIEFSPLPSQPPSQPQENVSSSIARSTPPEIHKNVPSSISHAPYASFLPPSNLPASSPSSPPHKSITAQPPLVPPTLPLNPPVQNPSPFPTINNASSPPPVVARHPHEKPLAIATRPSGSNSRLGISLPSSKHSYNMFRGLPEELTIVVIIVGFLLVIVFGILIWFLKKKTEKEEKYFGPYSGSSSHTPGTLNGSRKNVRSRSSNSGFSPYQAKRISPDGEDPKVVEHNLEESLGDISCSGSPRVNFRHSWKFVFSYQELEAATDGFSLENVLGEGDFGCVYKGFLANGQIVAVKQLKLKGEEYAFQFQAEIEIIGRVHHRNLVSLFGFCKHFDQWFLVYDYVSNGNLEQHLHREGRSIMDWTTRNKIARGVARGVAYLHEDCQPQIIHTHIKSSNILLDNNFDARVSDFGLTNHADLRLNTPVVGTFGYLAPECTTSGKLTERSDVYSFGVLLLELVTGRRSLAASSDSSHVTLVEWVKPKLSKALKDGNPGIAVDPNLDNRFERNEALCLLRAASACVNESPQRRPRMGQVVRLLEASGGDCDLSNGVKPGYSVQFSAEHASLVKTFQMMAFRNQDCNSEEMFRSIENGMCNSSFTNVSRS